MLFRKKPVVIEAAQWFKLGDHPAVTTACPDAPDSTDKGRIDTLEGGHYVTPGDWIITGVKGEHYPCKPDIFALTYEPALTPPEAAKPEADSEFGPVTEAELDEARVELPRRAAEAKLTRHTEALHAWKDRAERAEAERDRAVKDANRYRWLKANDNADLLAEDVIDEAIDAATGATAAEGDARLKAQEGGDG